MKLKDINLGTPTITKEQAERLDQLGFEGVDGSQEESLFEYGMMYSAKLERAIFCNWPYINCEGEGNLSRLAYDSFTITKEEILEALEDMPAGFFQMLGNTKETYYRDRVGKYPHLPGIIDDINSYNGLLTPSDYDWPLTLEQAIDRH